LSDLILMPTKGLATCSYIVADRTSVDMAVAGVDMTGLDSSPVRVRHHLKSQISNSPRASLLLLTHRLYTARGLW
jgi:hypothetical protein